MASLRDVLDHAGKKVRLERDGAALGEGLGILRGQEALVEARLAPRPADVLILVDGGRRFRIEEAHAEQVRGRTEHYRLRLAPL